MPDENPSELLGALPRSRPHRRSDKRPVRESAAAESAATESATAAPPRNTGRKATTRAKQGVTSAKPKPAAARAKPKPAAARAKAKPAASRAKPATAAAKTGRTARAARRRPAKPLPQPAQPAGKPASSGARPGPQSGGVPIVSTAVQAAAELAEIGLSLGGRALRRAVGRLPRP